MAITHTLKLSDETPKERFMKMYNSLPEKARFELVYGYWINPLSLYICMCEITNDTEFSKKILKDLGFDEVKKE